MITSLVPVWLAQAAPTNEELKTQIDLSANILLETFYFWTVVVMWLIHVGLHGVRGRCRATQEPHVDGDEEHPDDRRRHADLLLLRLVHLRLLRARAADHRPRFARRARRPAAVPGFLRTDRALGRRDGPEPPEPPERRLLPRVPPLLLDDRLDHVRRAHRARAALRVPHPHGDPRLVRVDHGRGLGLERRRLAHHPLRLPRRDRVGRRPRRGRASSRSAFSSISGRASGSTRRTGWLAASEGTTRTSR